LSDLRGTLPWLFRERGAKAPRGEPRGPARVSAASSLQLLPCGKRATEFANLMIGRLTLVRIWGVHKEHCQIRCRCPHDDAMMFCFCSQTPSACGRPPVQPQWAAL